MTLYNWMFWLHVFFGFVFFFVHGISMATAVFLPREKNIDRIKMLLDLPSITIAPMGVSLLILFVTSIYMGNAAQWWEEVGGSIFSALFRSCRLDDLVQPQILQPDSQRTRLSLYDRFFYQT